MHQTLVQQKRQYIKWFTENCTLKNQNCRPVLELFLNSNLLLSRVRLVENIRFSPNAILISAGGAKTVSFLFRINNKHVADVETLIYELITNPPDEIYLWLSFEREKIANLGKELVEGKNEVTLEQNFLSLVKKVEKTIVAKRTKRVTNKEKLLQRIDEALAKGDRDTFYKLAKLYKRISEK